MWRAGTIEWQGRTLAHIAADRLAGLAFERSGSAIANVP
jgi:hypothetical protein